MNLNNLFAATIAMIISIYIFSCSGENMPEEKISFPSIKDVPIEKWEKLTKKKIYFGHQSVGKNIMAGVKDLTKESPKIKLNIVKTSEHADLKASIFAHSAIGNNEDPLSKIESFAGFMKKGIGGKADIASLKFCFADIYSSTDIGTLFNTYKNKMALLKVDYPKTTFVHFTVPLLRKAKLSLKTWIEKILGKKEEYFDNAHNVKRNKFNDLLRKVYDGKEPLFDIAKIESTYMDGKRETFEANGKTYYSLVPEYTDDGGHLNETGRKKVAEQLLIFLANLN
jgi:hypothetical protein